MRKSKSIYENGKNVKKESYKSFYLFEEIEMLIEDIDYIIKISKISNFDNEIIDIYNEAEKIKKNVNNFYDNDIKKSHITFRELESLIRLYVIDINESINSRRIIRNYKLLYELYCKKDNNDRIFNKKLNEYTKGGSGILPKLVKYILNDGNI